MDQATLVVPPEHADDLLESLLDLYGLKAESLQRAATQHLRQRASPARLLAHRTELLALDALLDRLGWELDGARGPTRLTGDRALLREALAAAIARRADELGAGAADAAASPAALEGFRRSAEQVLGLVGLAARLDAGA